MTQLNTEVYDNLIPVFELNIRKDEIVNSLDELCMNSGDLTKNMKKNF